jgi:hypothetical protein
MAERTSPFVVGARVALQEGFTDSYTEQFVEKVYKNGNFTLRGRDQQWRPHCWNGYGEDKVSWSASKTGKGLGYARASVKIWDETTDAEIREKIDAQRRRTRLREIQERVNRLRDREVTDELLNQIEAALPSSAPL